MRVWNVDTGQEIHQLKGHARGVGFGSFSPDGTKLATVGGSSDVGPNATAEVKVWDVQTGRELFALKADGSVAFAPDGRRLATIAGKTVKIWDTSNAQELVAITDPGFAGGNVAFSPDSRRLAVASTTGRAKVIGLPQGAPRPGRRSSE